MLTNLLHNHSSRSFNIRTTLIRMLTQLINRLPKLTHNFPHLINRNRHRLFLLFPNRKLRVPHQLLHFIPQLIHQHLNIVQILDHNPIPNPH
uniref:Uncharacterized protein n=1 Tax=Helianthus annuus TaxID=4232 RepID=A0A251SYY5_HELAN